MSTHTIGNSSRERNWVLQGTGRGEARAWGTSYGRKAGYSAVSSPFSCTKVRSSPTGSSLVGDYSHLHRRSGILLHSLRHSSFQASAAFRSADPGCHSQRLVNWSENQAFICRGDCLQDSVGFKRFMVGSEIDSEFVKERTRKQERIKKEKNLQWSLRGQGFPLSWFLSTRVFLVLVSLLAKCILALDMLNYDSKLHSWDGEGVSGYPKDSSKLRLDSCYSFSTDSLERMKHVVVLNCLFLSVMSRQVL